MRKRLEEKLRAYVEEFNAQDEECYVQCVSNQDAFEFLKNQIFLHTSYKTPIRNKRIHDMIKGV